MSNDAKKQKVGQPCYCPGCLTVLPLRIDKNGNPYFRCQLCALTVFMGTEFAQVSFLMLQQIIKKSPDRWREMVKHGVTEKTRRDFARKLRADAGATV
jgi:hypothetical protein